MIFVIHLLQQYVSLILFSEVVTKKHNMLCCKPLNFVMKAFGYKGEGPFLRTHYIEENIVEPLLNVLWHEHYLASYLSKAADQKGAHNYKKYS